MSPDIAAVIRLLHQTRTEFLRLEREIDELTRMRCEREARAANVFNRHKYLRALIESHAAEPGLPDEDLTTMRKAITLDDLEVNHDSYEPEEGPDAGFLPGVRDWESEGGPR